MSSQELIGWNIRRLRTTKGISQALLAEIAGVDRTYVSRLERMIENPTVGILDKISLALDVTTAELFEPRSEDAAKLLRPLRAGRPPKTAIEPGT